MELPKQLLLLHPFLWIFLLEIQNRLSQSQLFQILFNELQIRHKKRLWLLADHLPPINLLKPGMRKNLLMSIGTQSCQLVYIQKPSYKILHNFRPAFLENDSKILVQKLLSDLLSWAPLERSALLRKLKKNYSERKEISLVRMVLMKEHFRRHVPRSAWGVRMSALLIKQTNAKVSNP